MQFQNPGSNNEDPFKRYTREEDLNAALGITPEVVADELSLSGVTRELFLRNASGPRMRLKAVTRDLAIIDFTAAHPSRPYELIRDFHDSLRPEHQRRIIELWGQTRFEVNPECIGQPGKEHLFPAWFIDLPGVLLPEREDPKAQLSQTLALRLPWEDLEKVQRHVRPSHSPFVPNAFGFVRFTVRNDGDLIVNEIRNDLYERLESNELLERYKEWPLVLFDALHYYIQSKSNYRAYTPNEDDKLSKIIPKRIVIPFQALCVDSDEAKEAPSAFWSIVEEEDNELKLTSPKQSQEELLQLYTEIPIGLGYRLEHIESEDRSKTEMGLVRSVAALQFATYKSSDFSGAGIFKDLPPSRYREIEDYVMNRFAREIYTRLDSGGMALAHHLPPTTKSMGLIGAKDIAERFLWAPSRSLEEKAISFRLGCDGLENWKRAKQADSNRLQLIEKVIGVDFTLISQGAFGKGDEEWWRIPTTDEPGVYVASTHLASQNRHPHLRFASFAANGEISDRFVVGFKGAGYIDSGSAVLPTRENSIVLPIERDTLKSKHEDPLDQGHPAPRPVYWGAEELDDELTELEHTIRFRNFLGQHAPHLQELLPLPVDIREYLALPYNQNGKNHWLSFNQYWDTFLDDEKIEYEGLGTYISISRSDVRVRQLIDRIFTRSDDARIDLKVAAEEIESSLKALYWWHNQPLELPTRSSLLEGGNIGTKDVLQYLSEVADLNRKSADQIFSTSAGDLAELVGLVHGCGGHLGGGWRQASDGRDLGVSYGGPLAIRNVDLLGGIHDFNLSYFLLPWAADTKGSWNGYARQLHELDRSQVLDLMYLGETVYWLESITYGRKNCNIGENGTERHCPNEFNDVMLLQSDDPRTVGMKELVYKAIEFGTPVPEALQLALPETIRERYLSGIKAGQKIAHLMPK